MGKCWADNYHLFRIGQQLSLQWNFTLKLDWSVRRCLNKEFLCCFCRTDDDDESLSWENTIARCLFVKICFHRALWFIKHFMLRTLRSRRKKIHIINKFFSLTDDYRRIRIMRKLFSMRNYSIASIFETRLRSIRPKLWLNLSKCWEFQAFWSFDSEQCWQFSN